MLDDIGSSCPKLNHMHQIAYNVHPIAILVKKPEIIRIGGGTSHP
jgi:hypothetical protein